MITGLAKLLSMFFYFYSFIHKFIYLLVHSFFLYLYSFVHKRQFIHPFFHSFIPNLHEMHFELPFELHLIILCFVRTLWPAGHIWPQSSLAFWIKQTFRSLMWTSLPLIIFFDLIRLWWVRARLPAQRHAVRNTHDPSKHATFGQCWVNVRLASQTVG